LFICRIRKIHVWLHAVLAKRTLQLPHHIIIMLLAVMTQDATELRRLVGSHDHQLRTRLTEISKSPKRSEQGKTHLPANAYSGITKV